MTYNIRASSIDKKNIDLTWNRRKFAVKEWIKAMQSPIDLQLFL